MMTSQSVENTSFGPVFKWRAVASMCKPQFILQYVMCITVLRVVSTLYTIAIGAYFIGEDTLHQGYSLSFIDTGAGLVVSGVIGLVTTVVGWKGNKTHNKFLLVLQAILDIVVAAVIVVLAEQAIRFTEPIFSQPYKLDCLRVKPREHTDTECVQYLHDHRVAGFRNAWAALFSEIDSNRDAYRILASLQAGNDCCGFSRPFNCTEDARPLPQALSTEGIKGIYTSQRLTCGPQPKYYMTTKLCVQYSDVTVVPPVEGGCMFEMPAGECFDEQLDDKTKGCAEAMERYLAAAVAPHCTVLYAFTAIYAMACCVSCCHCLKRKSTDVFPDVESPWYKAATAQDDPKEEINTRLQKMNFEIKPVRAAFEQRGYLPKAVQ